jgi:hypothetical protein
MDTISSASCFLKFAYVVTESIKSIFSFPHSLNNIQTKRKKLNQRDVSTSNSVAGIINMKEISNKYQLQNLLLTISRAFCIDKSTLMLSIIYLDNIIKANKVQLSSFTINCYLICCLILALKMNQDYLSLNYVLEVASINKSFYQYVEFNILEQLKYKLFVPIEVYELYARQFECIKGFN